MKNTYKLLLMAFLTTLIVSLPANASDDSSLSDELIAKLREDFQMNPHNLAMYNAVTNTTINDLAINREILRQHNEQYTHKIKTAEITNQRSTGRCWAFASLNILRPAVIKKYKLKEFQFAQNYIAFWDKLEKANLFLERIIEMRDRDPLDRDMTIILERPCPDGGDWEYVVHLINKYGLVPKEIMPETNSSQSTGLMNHILDEKLRKDAVKLREMHQNGMSLQQMRQAKQQMLAEVYKVLVLNLGTPPNEFEYRYSYKPSDDKDKDEDLLLSKLKTYTPKSFYKKFVGVDLSEYVDLFNDPAKLFNKLYQGRLSKSAQDAPDISYANIDIETMKSIVIKSLLDEQPVAFGADVGKDQSRSHGIMAVDMYDYESIFDIELKMSKAQRRLFQQDKRNHLMAFVGVDLKDQVPVKWKVENSWGDSNESEGFWAMYDSWFDEYVFNIIVHKKYVPKKVLKIFEQQPTILEPWDSMLDY